MSVIVKDGVILPNRILLAGMTGRISRKNTRITNPAGYVAVNADRDVSLRDWQIDTVPMDTPLASTIIAIAEVTDFGVYGLLLEDPIDSSVTVETGALQGYTLGVELGTTGFGNGGPRYGFRKIYRAYGSGSGRARAITRPRMTPAMYRGGAPVVIGAAAGNASISTGPAYVTFVPDATRAVSSITLGATTTVTLPTAIPGFVVGGRLWLQGLGGADAGLLNLQAHQITAITGAGLNVYTLAVNTTGKAITASGGQAHKYPQPTEVLTWSGRFYVPVHFRNDDLEWELVVAGPEAGRMVVIPQTFLDEIREA